MAKHIVNISSAGVINRPGEPSSTALVAAMAVLQADGASPTEAHVDTADAALTTYLAAQTAETAGQLTVVYDTTMTLNQVKVALKAALLQIEGIS